MKLVDYILRSCSLMILSVLEAGSELPHQGWREGERAAAEEREGKKRDGEEETERGERKEERRTRSRREKREGVPLLFLSFVFLLDKKEQFPWLVITKLNSHTTKNSSQGTHQ